MDIENYNNRVSISLIKGLMVPLLKSTKDISHPNKTVARSLLFLELTCGVNRYKHGWKHKYTNDTVLLKEPPLLK